MSGRALVLAAHGSRRDPAANALVRRLAEALRGTPAVRRGRGRVPSGRAGVRRACSTSSRPTRSPSCRSSPARATTARSCSPRRSRAIGASAMCGCGRTPPVGTHAGIAPLVARRVTELLRDDGLEREAVALVLVGHGTRRHPQSRAATEQLAETLRRRRVAGEVIAAFLDDDPPLEDALAAARARDRARRAVPHRRRRARAGGHSPPARSQPDGDPRRGRVDGRLVVIDEPVGSYPGLDEIVLDLARRHTPPPAPRFRPRMMAPARKEPGTVHLVGGGPGDPGLITSRGLDLLRTADVVVHDRLIGPELLREARTDAELIDVGQGAGPRAVQPATRSTGCWWPGPGSAGRSSGSRVEIRSCSGAGARRRRPAARRAFRSTSCRA